MTVSKELIYSNPDAEIPYPQSFMTSGQKRVIVFVDGENLTINYGRILEERGEKEVDHIIYEKDVYVWSKHITQYLRLYQSEVLRKFYYTSSTGNEVKFTSIKEKLKALGIEVPRVFKREKGEGKRAKGVDISLAVDMLTYAHKKNYDTAVLIAGDGDYVPLVKAVMGEGRRVVLWYLNKGLSPELKMATDHYFDLGHYLLNPVKALEFVPR